MGRIALLAGLGCIVLGLLAPPAGANYGRIAAVARCDRVVTWTASASSEGSDDERTNVDVHVDYRAAGTDDGWTVDDADGRFDPAGDFTFSGSFELPPSVDAVEVRVQPQTSWGPDEDGDAAGSPRFATATVPDECAAQPLVATITPDCTAGGATVTVQNLGSTPVTTAVSADQMVVRDLQVPAGGSAEVVVPVLEGTTTAVRVNAGEFIVAQQQVSAACGTSGAAATITERCGVRQAVVAATVGDGSAEAIEIRVAGTIVQRDQVVPGTVLQRTLELPATGTVPVVVELGGEVRATAEVGSCTGPVAGGVSCGAAGQPACTLATTPPTTLPAPPPPPPPATVELGEQGAGTPMLPVTGPWQRAIVLFLGGGLLILGGMVVVVEQRRRPDRSLLAEVVAPYRQRWWDES